MAAPIKEEEKAFEQEPLMVEQAAFASQDGILSPRLFAHTASRKRAQV